MAHGEVRDGKWRGNWWMEWVASTLHTTSGHGVSSITTADAHTSAASIRLNWRPPADGLVSFAERRNLVSCACAITFQMKSTNPWYKIKQWPTCSVAVSRWLYRVSFLPAQGHQPWKCRHWSCSCNWAPCFAPRSRPHFLFSTDFS